MSNAKMQKILFDSTKRLKLKEFKYDANPSVRWRLFKSFYGQLVSILSGEDFFQGILLDNFEIHPFHDTTGAPSKAFFMLLVTYINKHYKTVIRRKGTNGFGDKAILALQLNGFGDKAILALQLNALALPLLKPIVLIKSLLGYE
jgi:hypothetical protein